MRQYLMIPGPTQVPDRVLRAMAKPMINHRGSEFGAIFKEATEGLKGVFQTKNDVLIFPCSGTGALEASIVNALSPGDKALVVSIGAFGERVADICKAFGINAEVLKYEWGLPANPKDIKEKLEKNPDIKAVFVTHNETSTGVTNDLEAISKVVKAFDALFIVDAVSSLGAIDLQTDNWGADIVAAASQKALMVPPGLGIVSVSEKAWEAVKKSRSPKSYWSFEQAKKSYLKDPPQTPYTPAVSQIFGLQESLAMIREEGLQNIFKRHELIGKACRTAAGKLELELFAKANYSSAVTAIKVPFDVDEKTLRKKLRESYGVVLAGGQKDFAGKIFRIGHVGYVSKMDVLAVLSALELALSECNHPVKFGSGVGAAEEVFSHG